LKNLFLLSVTRVWALTALTDSVVFVLDFVLSEKNSERERGDNIQNIPPVETWLFVSQFLNKPHTHILPLTRTISITHTHQSVFNIYQLWLFFCDIFVSVIYSFCRQFWGLTYWKWTKQNNDDWIAQNKQNSSGVDSVKLKKGLFLQ